jgi:ribosomal protein L24E
MDEITKCKYCGKEIETGTIRCDTCNQAWSAGYEKGKETKAFESRCLIVDIKTVIGAAP